MIISKRHLHRLLEAAYNAGLTRSYNAGYVAALKHTGVYVTGDSDIVDHANCRCAMPQEQTPIPQYLIRDFDETD